MVLTLSVLDLEAYPYAMQVRVRGEFCQTIYPPVGRDWENPFVILLLY